MTYQKKLFYMFRKPFLLLLLIVIAQAAYSQLSITYPVQRQVFQRSTQNTATITVTGTYSQPVDTIWVRFTPVQTGQGTTKFTNWTLLKANPLGGLFKGTITLEAGWYKMDLKGTLRDTLVGKVASLERVGVGEVFVIAGQSNAGGSGLLETNETAASDDRVNCANFISPRNYNPRGWSTPESPNSNISYPFSRFDLAQFSIVEFSQLKKTAAIGPMGLGPSYWGKVGDALASKLNVPIMFFNTAWAGASVRVWRESAENPTASVPSDFQPDPNNPTSFYPVGYPYSNLKAVLGYYGVNMGIRAILWMEGETQNLLNLTAERNKTALPVTIDSYKDNLEKLIKRTRSDLGNDLLPWVVARTSYSGDLDCGNPNSPPPKPSPVIVSAQNKVLSNSSMFPLFPGPFTDSIQVAKIGEREQCVHFTGKGLDQVSSEWVRVLTETVKVGTTNQNFFSSIAPVVADTIPSVSLDCVSGTSIRLSLPSGYVNYIWYGDNIQDANTTQRSVLVGSGSYIARVTKANGNVIQIPAFTVKVNPPPAAPKVTALSSTNFCVGTSVGLSSTNGAIYTWVNSAGLKLPSTKNVTASTDGVYQVKIVDENGCQSGLSSPVILTSKPRPQQPVISYTSTEFCEGFSVKLTSSNTDNPASYLWSSGEIAKSIEIKKTGTFSVQTRGVNGCLSVPSDSIHTLANYTPPAPIIRNQSDSVFCDGGETTMSITPITDNYKFILWSGVAKDSTSRFNKGQITIKETELIRAYLQTSKGCVSKASNAIQIVKKIRPSVPVLDQLGTYTLRGRSTTIPSEYVWKKDGVLFPNDKSPVKDSIIKVIEDGSYTVSAKNNYKIQSSLLPLVCAALGESKIAFTTYDDKGLSIFPNPSKGIFFLDSRYDIDNATITVYNVKGQELLKGTLPASKSIDLTPFGSGMYILRLVTSKYTFTKTLALN
jgi:hypothetical protein